MMMRSSSQEEGAPLKEPIKPEPFMKRKRSLIILVILVAGNFFVASVTSLQAPFFPSEAERKGATATQYGFVFGIFQLVFFLTAPVAGKLVAIVPPKFLLCCGLLILGTCCVLFGILNYAPSGTPFLAMAFTIRIVEGVGAAAYTTTSFTIVAAEFPDRVGTTFATVGAFFGVGLIVGPTLGGALYEVGGYTLPFAVIGSVLVIYACAAYLILPHVEEGKKSERVGLKETLQFWLNFRCLVPAVCIFVNFMNIGFNSALLEPHIRQFNMTPFLVGLMFIISGGIYGITATLWGYLTDRWICPKVMCLIGTIWSSLFLILIGPAPFFPIDTKLWLVILSLVFFGFGSGMQFVCAFTALKRDTKLRGYPETMTTNGLVSSVFATSQSLGNFLGPSLTGYLYDTIGYRKCTMVLLSLELCVVCITTVYVIQERRTKSRREVTSATDERASLVVSNKTEL